MNRSLYFIHPISNALAPPTDIGSAFSASIPDTRISVLSLFIPPILKRLLVVWHIHVLGSKLGHRKLEMEGQREKQRLELGRTSIRKAEKSANTPDRP
ncbi:glycerol-3-phosphate dehydrogenase [Moniliophthora roreri]|nr:glycerol-3-phosphate dehydrogenase [Moniliophthora roreri]